jgi:hypothetical protein
MSNLRVLYITESTFNFSQVDPTSTLIERYEKHLPPGTYHTSLGDVSVDSIIRLAKQFDSVEFESRGFDTKSAVYKESLTLYKYLTKKSTNQFGPEDFTDHGEINSRLDQPMLWVFGCSHSHGVGLRAEELNYGQWLSKHLNMPLKLITKPGSSLNWSHRHLFNSQIQAQDIVVWQLTTPGRVSRFNGKLVEEIVLTHSTDRRLLDSITDEQLYFAQLNLLNTGIKFLQSIKCKFLLTSICTLNSHYEYVSEYIKYPEYCSNYGLHLDNGTDGVHAGPLSHKAIARALLNHVQLLNE